MRIAVAGGTGVAGHHAVAAAEARGHDVRVLSRSRGVDVTSDEELVRALDGVDVVVDALNLSGLRGGQAEAFFTDTSTRLQRVGATQGVGHIVTLSILGIDRASDYGYYRAKLAQERAVMRGPIPMTILRAAQFHEFPAQILSVTRKGPLAPMVNLRSQPVAARTVGEHLVRAAEDRPGGVTELAGPQVRRMPHLARMFLRARGVRAVVVPIPLPGAAGRAMRSGALLATDATTLDGPTFEAWLATDDAARMPV